MKILTERAVALLMSAAREEGRQEAFDRLHGDGWWFSEHPPTQELLQDLALAGWGPGRLAELREKWRKKMKAASEEEG